MKAAIATISISRELKAQTEEAAKRDGLSFSSYVRLALSEKIRREQLQGVSAGQI